MKARETDLLSAGVWDGEFHSPGLPDQRITGAVSYSPERGVRLEYFVNAGASGVEGCVLHGTLVTGEQVTLFGAEAWFQPEWRNGTPEAGCTGDAPFYALCVGAHLPPDAVATDFLCSVPALDAFVAPPMGEAPRSWLPGSLVQAVLPDGDVRILPYERVCDAHPRAQFLVRQSRHHNLEFHYTEGVPLKDGFFRCQDLCGLLALLAHAPVHPETLEANFAMAGALSARVAVFPTFPLHTETVYALRGMRGQCLIPLSLEAIQFPQVIPRWLDAADRHAGLVADLQARTGLHTGQGLRGMIVLYATQFESIAQIECAPHDKRYEHALARHASMGLREKFGKYATGNEPSQLAKLVSELRNEIAHIGKPQRRLPKLGGGLPILVMCMELVIIGYILRDIGVDNDAVDRYQDYFAQAFCLED